MSNDIFLQELTPIEKGGENENGSLYPLDPMKYQSPRPRGFRDVI